MQPVAPKANDATVVHLAGTETISGVKQFSVPPSLPTPVHTTDAANKAYVDTGLAAKAALVSGVVPTSELGSGTSNNSVCLHGDSTWSGCGTSNNAVAIQGVPVATTAPSANQVLTYVSSLGEYAPTAGGGISTGMQAVKYATDFCLVTIAVSKPERCGGCHGQLDCMSAGSH